MAVVLHGSARTTPRVRAELQASKGTTGVLARRYGLSRATVKSGVRVPKPATRRWGRTIRAARCYQRPVDREVLGG
jgi:hypothetical protein